MFDKEYSDTKERVEAISYQPGLQDSGDLESGTKTITATSEASGIGNADYSYALTLAKPTDARLEVKRIASRLAVTIDSMTAGYLFCRVYVDAQDVGHLLFDKAWATTGAKAEAVDTHSAYMNTIFSLLKDGSAHTFYFFLWVDSGNAVISVVQLWEAVGSGITGGNNLTVIEISHVGYLSLWANVDRVGTGNPMIALRLPDNAYIYYASAQGQYGQLQVLNFLHYNEPIGVSGTVTTDLNLMSGLDITLRSVQ